MVKLTEAVVAQVTKLDNLQVVKNLNVWGRGLTDVSLHSSYFLTVSIPRAITVDFNP